MSRYIISFKFQAILEELFILRSFHVSFLEIGSDDVETIYSYAF